MKQELYFLASEGDRHEDAIPEGVYTLDGLNGLKYIPIGKHWEDITSEAGDDWIYFSIIENSSIDGDGMIGEEEARKIMSGDYDQDDLYEEFTDFIETRKIVKISINEKIPHC